MFHSQQMTIRHLEDLAKGEADWLAFDDLSQGSIGAEGLKLQEGVADGSGNRNCWVFHGAEGKSAPGRAILAHQNGF
jgi:hypothetical protein